MNAENEEKKLIAVISPAKFPSTSGDTSNYSEMINQLVIQGFKILLICPKNPESNDKNTTIHPDVKIIRIPYVPPRLKEIKNDFGIKNYLKFFLFLLIESFTVLWIIKYKKIRYVIMRHSILTMQLPVIFKLLRIRVMADGAELISDSFKDQINSKILEFVRKYEKKVITFYTYYKVFSRIQGENLQRFGFPKEKILIAPVGINLDKIPRHSLEEIHEHTFGYFGVLERWQGVDILLNAFTLLLKDIPNATLYIMGEGSLKEELKEMTHRNSVSSNVVFITVSREVLWNEYFRKFRIVVIPRPKQTDTTDTILPIKLVESLAAAKPTIVMNIPIMNEIPRDSVQIVPEAKPESLANTMKTLSMDIKKMKELAQVGYTYSRSYDIKDMIKKVTDVLIERNF